MRVQIGPNWDGLAAVIRTGARPRRRGEPRATHWPVLVTESLLGAVILVCRDAEAWDALASSPIKPAFVGDVDALTILSAAEIAWLADDYYLRRKPHLIYMMALPRVESRAILTTRERLKPPSPVIRYTLPDVGSGRVQ